MGKCIEKCRMLQKSHLYKTTTRSSLCFLNYPNNFMFFLMRQSLGRQTMAKYLRNAWSQESKFIAYLFTSDDLVSTYFVRTGHMTWIKNFFSNQSLLHNLRHSHTKNMLDSWCHAEIFKIKNCSVGNLFKYIIACNVKGSFLFKCSFN